MSLIKPKERKLVLKEFGQVMAIALLVVSNVLLWRANSNGFFTAFAAGLFLAFAYLAPLALEWPERIWMKFAEKLSVVMTTLLITLNFYLMITPMAFLLKVLKKDLLGLKFDRQAETYWVAVEPDGPGSRPFLPY